MNHHHDPVGTNFLDLPVTLLTDYRKESVLRPVFASWAARWISDQDGCVVRVRSEFQSSVSSALLVLGGHS